METATVQDTGSEIAETTTGSAPAIAEPSGDSPAESTRPTSMRDAFERIEKKQAASMETAATGQAAPGAKPVAPQGPIPFDVHTKALENARTKASTDALAKHREQFGWAEKISQQQLQEWGDIARKVSTDPIAHVQAIIADIEKHPQWGPMWASRQGQPSPAAKQDTPLTPDIEVRDDKGNVTGATFSAERVQAIVAKAVADAIGKEVTPLKTDFEQRQAEVKRQEQQRLETQQADYVEKATKTAFDEVRQILDIKTADEKAFSEGELALIVEVNKLMAQTPGLTAHSAALKVRETHVVPKMKGAATQEAITEMQRKAHGNTANGAGRTATPKRPTNPKELSAWMRERDQSA